jgi:hypothetical protein
VGVHHVEVTLVDGNVDRLAHGAAGVVQPRRGVRQLDEVLEIVERSVPSTAREVAHERRAVRRREHDVVAADLDRPIGVASVLRERRGGGGAQRAHVSRIEAHSITIDRRAGLPEQPHGHIVVDVHADLSQDLVALLLDQRQAFLAEQLVVRDLATDERRRGRVCVGVGA